MHVQLFAKMDSGAEACGSFSATYYGVALRSFLTPKKTLCTCVMEKVSLTSRMKNLWSLYMSRTELLSAPYHFYLGLLVHRGQTSTAQPGAHLSAASNP